GKDRSAGAKYDFLGQYLLLPASRLHQLAGAGRSGASAPDGARARRRSFSSRGANRGTRARRPLLAFRTWNRNLLFVSVAASAVTGGRALVLAQRRGRGSRRRPC